MKIDRIRLQRLGRPAIDLHISIVGQWEPYILLNADGLGPPDSELFYENFQDYEGSGSGVVGLYDYEPRVITFLVKLNPQTYQSHSELRDKFYRDLLFGASNQQLNVTFYNNNNQVANIYGFTKELQSNLFTAEPSISYTVECPNPFFMGNVVILDHTKLNSGSKSISFVNAGTAMSGLEVRGNIMGSGASFGLSLNSRMFSTGSQMPNDGIVDLDSSDHVFRLDLKGVDKAFDTVGSWPRVMPGSNILSAGSSSKISFTMVRYRERFAGI